MRRLGGKDQGRPARFETFIVVDDDDWSGSDADMGHSSAGYGECWSKFEGKGIEKAGHT